jgi:hypothetical protein
MRRKVNTQHSSGRIAGSQVASNRALRRFTSITSSAIENKQYDARLAVHIGEIDTLAYQPAGPPQVPVQLICWAGPFGTGRRLLALSGQVW